MTFNWANGSNSSNTNSAVTTITVGSTNSKTTNGSISQNDILIASVVVTTTTTPAPGTISVSGFTPIIQQTDTSADLPVTYYAGYKISGSSEGGTYAATWTVSSRGASWALLDYSGISTGNVIDTSAFQNNDGFSTNMAAPRPTMTSPTDTLIVIFTNPGTQGPVVGDAGLTTRFNVWATGLGDSARPGILVQDLVLSSSGQIAQYTATQAAVDTSNTMAFGLIPSGSGGVAVVYNFLTLLGIGS